MPLLTSRRTVVVPGMRRCIETCSWPATRSRIQPNHSPYIPSMRNNFFFLGFFFWCGPVFKVFIEFVTILLLFYVLEFWPRGMWDLNYLTSDQTCTPSALEGEVLTTGPPGKSWEITFLKSLIWVVCYTEKVTNVGP